jgi:hypothetical protein
MAPQQFQAVKGLMQFAQGLGPLDAAGPNIAIQGAAFRTAKLIEKYGTIANPRMSEAERELAKRDQKMLLDAGFGRK